jgi:hypothetical protein
VQDGHRRIDGTQDERAEEMNALERPTDDVGGQRFDIENDVGELGQRYFFNQATICSRVQ